VVVSSYCVSEIPDPNIPGKGDLHPIAPKVKFTTAEFRLEGSGEDGDPAILDLHNPDLGELLELVQVFQVLLVRRWDPPEGVETLLVCAELPGLGRDPTSILFQVLLGEAHLLFQKGGLFLQASSTFLQIGVAGPGLALSAPRGRCLLCLLPKRLERVLEGLRSKGRECSELLQDPREAQVKQPPQKEWPEFPLLPEEVKEKVDVRVDNLADCSSFLVFEHLSAADLDARREGLLGWWRDGIPDSEGEAALRDAGPDPEQDGRGREGEVMHVDGLTAERPRVMVFPPQEPDWHPERFGVMGQHIRDGRQSGGMGRGRDRSLSAFEEKRKFRRNARLPLRAISLRRNLGKGRDMRSLG
jgi:hypothetical protein